MKLTPIIFSWLALLISLSYINTYDWHDIDRERQWDWYWGYADTLASEGRYQNCTPEPDSIHCATPIPERAYRLPGYPLFLAGVILIAPDHPAETVKAFQAVLMAMITLIAVHWSLHWSVGVGRLTGLLMLGAGDLYWHVPIIFTEILFTFILCIFAQAFITGRWRLTGVLWGLSLVIRTSLIFATPLLLLVIPRRQWGWFIAGSLLMVLPMVVRNYIVLDTFAPFGTNGGTVLKAGHNAESYQTGKHVAPQKQADWSQFAGLSEVEQDKALRKSAFEYATSQPLGVHLRAMWQKIKLAAGPQGLLLVVVWGGVAALEWRRHAKATGTINRRPAFGGTD